MRLIFLHFFGKFKIEQLSDFPSLLGYPTNQSLQESKNTGSPKQAHENIVGLRLIAYS